MIKPYYRSSDHAFNLVCGDTFELLPQFDFKFDMIFADPPYFLSNGGISVQSGQIVCVDKGAWDKGVSSEEINGFNLKWLSLCREKLKDKGTIWISGTYHNIFSVANALTELDYKILNVITWVKTNPPPNISCRYFTYSTEFVIWARKSKKVPHYYNYEMMKHINGSTEQGAWILDPFAGSSTTGIAANLLGRRFLGIEREEEFAAISKARREEIENLHTFLTYRKKISDIVKADEAQTELSVCCCEGDNVESLPFLSE